MIHDPKAFRDLQKRFEALAGEYAREKFIQGKEKLPESQALPSVEEALQSFDALMRSLFSLVRGNERMKSLLEDQPCISRLEALNREMGSHDKGNDLPSIKRYWQTMLRTIHQVVKIMTPEMKEADRQPIEEKLKEFEAVLQKHFQIRPPGKTQR